MPSRANKKTILAPREGPISAVRRKLLQICSYELFLCRY
jgi:hypothetical protein